MKQLVKCFVPRIRQCLPWAILLLALVLLGVALYVGEPIWWVFACFSLAVVGYGLIYTLLSRLCVRVHIVEESVVVQRNDRYAAHAEITWYLPLLWNGIRLAYASHEGEDVMRGQCFVPPPRGFLRTVHQSVLLPLNTRYKGIYPIGLSKAEMYDLIGLFRAKLPIRHPEGRVLLTVYPRAVQITDHQLMSHLQQGALPSHNVFEAGLSGENRTYIVGDPLRMVNWKLTARMGELYVKQQDDDSSAGINLYIGAIPPSADSLELEQLAADQAASIAMQVLSLHPRMAFYAYPSASPISFGGTGQFDAVLQFLIAASLQSQDYAPDLEISVIRENLHQINVAILPAHATREVFSLLLSMRRDSILFVNGVLPEDLRAELEQTALTQGVAMIVTAPAGNDPKENQGEVDYIC